VKCLTLNCSPAEVKSKGQKPMKDHRNNNDDDSSAPAIAADNDGMA
jgi:hypothetical protein